MLQYLPAEDFRTAGLKIMTPELSVCQGFWGMMDRTPIAIDPDSISGLELLGSLHTRIVDSVAGYSVWLCWRELAWWF